MEYETLQFSISDDIATIRMNRPDESNALNAQMRAELLHAFELAEDDARVIVLTGEGRVFCSGQDIGNADDITDIDVETTLREQYLPLIMAIANTPVPTISAVNGAAAGAGFNLALCTDIAIAKESAYFMPAFATLGLIPDAGSSYWLPRKIGMARAMGSALLSERISAAKADDWGMIWRCVADDEFDETLKSIAEKLAKGPTRAFELTRQALAQSLDHSLEQQLELECHLQGRASRTRDFREAIAAFINKRQPEFEGR